MNLLINLFRDSDYIRLGSQILVRKFQLDTKLDYLDEMDDGSDKFRKFKNECLKAARDDKYYTEIMGNHCDSKFPLELLGVGAYSKTYTVVVDFAKSLDLVLALLTGCDIKNIRTMENYKLISEQILSYNLKDNSENFSVFLDLDTKLSQWIYNAIREVDKTRTSDNLDLEEAAQEFFAFFYSEISKQLEMVKDYVGANIKTTCPSSNAVYRSKSFTKIIVSSDICIEGKLKLVYKDLNYEVDVHSYKTFEYVERCVINDEKCR